MKTIWKFPLALEGHQEVEMPKGAIIRHVGLDPTGSGCLWAEVDSEAPKEKRGFYIRGTGHPRPEMVLSDEKGSIQIDKYVYLGAICQDLFVWHVMEEINRG